MRAVLTALALAGLAAAASAETQTKYNFTGSLTAEPKAKPKRTKQSPGSPFGAFSQRRPARVGIVQPANVQPELLQPRPTYRGMEIVPYSRSVKPGTIVINTAERRLYHVLAGGMAERYGIGVGREGFTWRGVKRISRKTEWPSWSPPARMIEREKAKGNILPTYMAGGPNNPLGARAMYLGSSLFRIHGTNQPSSIGTAVSSGCIRMLNEEVVQLYDKVALGTTVIVE